MSLPHGAMGWSAVCVIMAFPGHSRVHVLFGIRLSVITYTSHLRNGLGLSTYFKFGVLKQKFFMHCLMHKNFEDKEEFKVTLFHISDLTTKIREINLIEREQEQVNTLIKGAYTVEIML